MGFRYRKSINLGGGFRINVSKSGIGYSWGGKGFRLTKTAKGTIRTTVSIPGTGISFTEESGAKKNSPSTSEGPPHLDNPTAEGTNHYNEILNGNAANMISEDLEDMLSAAKRTIAANRISTIGIIISFIFSASYPILGLLLFAFIALKIYAKTSGQIRLDYTIDNDQKDAVLQRMKPMLQAANSSKVWRILQSSDVIDKKRSFGASSEVKRTTCKVSKKLPFPLKTNTTSVSFRIGKEILIFLPDKLFIIQGGKIGALNYSDISINAHTIDFIETESVPNDANIHSQTWEYVNKSGDPDNRFKNNRQVPVCQYGKIELSSATGLNTILMYSNTSS